MSDMVGQRENSGMRAAVELCEGARVETESHSDVAQRRKDAKEQYFLGFLCAFAPLREAAFAFRYTL